MKKTFIGLMGLALLTPLFSIAQPAKHHVNKEGGNVMQTTQYRNTPDYTGKQNWEIRKDEWLAKQPAKQHIGRENQSEHALRAAQYKNTAAVGGGAQNWEVKQSEWQAKQPAKHHVNRNK